MISAELAPTAFSPSEAEREKILSALLPLLEQEARTFAGPDSSSLPESQARELLLSLLYTLETAARADGIHPALLLRQCSPAEVLLRGRRLLEARRQRAEHAWQELCRCAPAVPNAYYRDTLRSLGDFFRRYDIRYAAHQIPCSIDYPLLRPVPESLSGISYVEA